MKKTIALTLIVLFTIPALSGFSQEDASLLSEPSRKISMDFDNAPVKDVLKILSQQSGLNFVSSEEIESKNITVYFDRVAVKDALASIMSANDLTYEQKEGSDIFVVYSAGSEKRELTTKVFRLKYKRLSTSPLGVGSQNTISELARLDIPTSTGGNNSGSTSVSSASGTAGSAAGIDLLITRLLSRRGSLTLDASTNSLIVTDTNEKLKVIGKVLEELDVPSAQVLLEVYVMEVKKDILTNIGIEWGGTDGEMFSFAGASRTTELPFSSGLFKKDLGLDIAANSVGTVTTGSISATSFTAALHFIKSQADTKILAQPRILTLNNEAAIIKLVTNAAISANTTLTTSGNLTQSTTDVERAELGISLKMTPQINQEDNSIDLFLQPAVTTAEQNTFFTGNVILDPTTRIVRTLVRVKNEKTIVIGGLLDRNQSLTRRKVPVLGDIPVLGHAFSYDDGSNIDREILIFITPHIIQSEKESEELSLQYNKERNAAVSRIVDAFMDAEMEKALEIPSVFPKNNSKKRVAPDRTETKRLSPAMEKEMSVALNSFEFKNTKSNR